MLNSFMFYSCVLVSIISGAFSILVLFKGGYKRVNILCSGMALSISIWSLGLGLMIVSSTYSEAIFYLKYIHYLGAIPIAPLFLHFVLAFFDIEKRNVFIIRFNYFLVIILEIANFSGYLASVKPKLWFNYYTQPLMMYPVFTVMFTLDVFLCFYFLLKKYKSSKGVERLQRRYLTLGLIISYLGGFTTFPLVFGHSFYPFGVPLAVAYVLAATYAIIRYQLMDIRLVISRTVLFLLVYIPIFGVPFIITIWKKELLKKCFGEQLWIFPTILEGVFAIIGLIVYLRIQKLAEAVILKDQRHYQKLLMQAAGGMVSQHNLKHLLKLTVFIVKRIVKIKYAAVFLIEQEEKGVYIKQKRRAKRSLPTTKKKYVLKTIRNSGRILQKTEFLMDSILIKYLCQKEEPVIYEELPKDVKKELTDIDRTGLIVPTFTRKELIGFIILGEKLNKQPYSGDDLNVFKILSSQTSLAIENCLFFEESQRLQQQIFSADKLATLGGMADGVAHQMKNRLNQFSIVAGEQQFELKEMNERYQEMISKDPAFKKSLDYLIRAAKNICDNTQRTANIIKGILDYARSNEKDTYFSKFHLREIIQGVADVVLTKHQLATLPLKVNLGKSDMIYGIKVQIKEVILNLLDNAYEAGKEKLDYLIREKKSDQGYKPGIELTLKKEDNGSALIEVKDNGVGIKEEDRGKIFAPFFTTKSSYVSGEGIGTFIIKRMIEENHRGKIWFDSEYMKGTSFFVRLPPQDKGE